MLPLLLLFSLFLLVRGHDSPGGGFIGGLIASCGLALYAITHGSRETLKLLPTKPHEVGLIGLFLVLIAGLMGFIHQGAFLESSRLSIEWSVIGKPGTTLIFDTGVYLVVIGTISSVVFSLVKK